MQKKKSKNKLVWTEQQLAEYQDRHKNVGDKDLQNALDSFHTSPPVSKDIKEQESSSAQSKALKKKNSKVIIAQSWEDLLPQNEQGKPSPKKRRGISVKPILESLKEPEMKTWSGIQPNGAHGFSVWLEGARVLTVNELISIYQYRKFETFAYKNRWKALMQNAVDQVLLTQKPYFFEKNTRLILYRRGKRLIDLDSLPTVFKYATDGLKKAGLIAEDNPNVIVEVIPIQEKGEPAIGLRLEELLDWKESTQDWGSVWNTPDFQI